MIISLKYFNFLYFSKIVIFMINWQVDFVLSDVGL